MAEKTDFSQLDPKEALKRLDKLANEAAKANAPAIATFARFQEQRASRLNQGLKRLKKEVGEDHPAFAAVKAGAERAASMNMQFKAQSARVQARTMPKSYEWVIFGQVLSADGTPAKGLTVRALDRDRRYDDLLGQTETDANGDFSVTYHERDFKETGEQLPELYVMVFDPKGKELYTSRDDVRFRAGRSEYFLIRLGKTARTTKPRTTRKPRTRRTSGE
jgi:hypothetical protein